MTSNPQNLNSEELRDATSERMAFTKLEDKIFSELCMAVVMHPGVEDLVKKGVIDPLYEGEAKQRVLIDRTKAIVKLIKSELAPKGDKK